MTSPTEQLSGFLAALRYEHLPAEVVARSEGWLLDWPGPLLAGRGHPRKAWPAPALHQGDRNGQA